MTHLRYVHIYMYLRHFRFKWHFLSIYLWLYSPLLSLGRSFTFLIIYAYTAGRSPWTGDQPVARPLPTHRTTHKKNSDNTDIYALSGIRTNDPSVQAREDSSCLRPRGHCDRLKLFCTFLKFGSDWGNVERYVHTHTHRASLVMLIWLVIRPL
jgi:hypothetical protein